MEDRVDDSQTMSENTVIAFEKPATLRERIEEFLRESIMQGNLRAGQKLREAELCEQLQVSRPTLREALRTLEAERLIVIEPHRGPSVARVTRKAALDLYALRGLLEGYAAREFARHADSDLVEQLRNQVAELARQAGLADRAGLLSAKQRFYQILLEGCDNELVAQMLPGLLSRINLLRATSFSKPDRTPQSIEEIQEILRCIDNRDPAGAEAAARRHIWHAQRAALDVLAKEDLVRQNKGETGGT